MNPYYSNDIDHIYIVKCHAASNSFVEETQQQEMNKKNLYNIYGISRPKCWKAYKEDHDRSQHGFEIVHWHIDNSIPYIWYLNLKICLG